MQKQATLIAAASLMMALGLAAEASDEQLHRSNWVPSTGSVDTGAGEQYLGDMWTFNCPDDGSFSVSVDTKDDTGGGMSGIDPILIVFDGKGNVIAFGDDNMGCTYPPVCGFACPAADGNCGQGGQHSIIVRDFGPSGCNDGGGYELTMEVWDANGVPINSTGVALGGGPRRSIPKWALKSGAAPVGPALDDEDVPNPSFSTFTSLFGQQSLTTKIK